MSEQANNPGKLPKKPEGISQERWIDRLILEAQKRGDFDHLPGAGKPIEDIKKPYEPDWWVKKLLEREHLSIAPEPLALRNKIEKLREEIPKLASEEAVRKQVKLVNELVQKINGLPSPTALPPLSMLEEADMLEEWKRLRKK